MSDTPTLLVPVGALGEATLARIEKTVGAGDDLRTHRAPEGPEALKQTLDNLLRVGRTPRLDVLVFADGTEALNGKLVEAVSQVSEVLKAHFARVFPASAAPDQRAAALQVVLYTPALAESPGAQRALAALEELLQWNDTAPHPTLARVWLAAQQTAAGVLSDADLVSQGAGFALAVLGAGIRDSDAVQRRLSHPVGAARIGFVSVATLDLPLGQVETWARTRAAYAAMSCLVQRVAAAEGRMRGLEPDQIDRWLAPFTDGPEAETLKAAAWKLAGGKELPERVTLGPLDGSAAVKRRYDALFTAPEANLASSTAVSDALSALDGVHAEVVGQVHEAVDAPFAGRLGEVRPLADLPALEHTLELLRRKLAVREEQAPRTAQVEGPELEVLEQATAALPSGKVLRMLGIATATAVGFAVIGLLAGLLLRPPPAAASGMTSGVRVQGQAKNPVTLTHVVPWVGGVLSGGAAGVVVMMLAGRRSRATLLELLKARAEALQAARSSGLASGPSALAAERLSHHRARIRDEAERAVNGASERIGVIRQALIGCRSTLGERLDGFGIPAQQSPDAEDLTPLFEAETPFHAPLLGPAATRDWVRRARRFADEEVLADRIVDGSMPRDGLKIDVPASDPDQVLELAKVQTQALVETSLFDDETAAAEIAQRAEQFARSVISSLRPGCQPRRDDGLPEPGVRPGEAFVVGPADGRATLENALSRSQISINEQYWTPGSTPLVLFVRTWEGFTLEQLKRGLAG